MSIIPPIFGNTDPNAQMAPDQIKKRRLLANAFLEQGADTSPVNHPLQALARVAQTGAGMYANHRLDQQQKAGMQLRNNALMNIGQKLGGLY